MGSDFLLLLIFAGSIISLPLLSSTTNGSSLFSPLRSAVLFVIRCAQVLGVGLASLTVGLGLIYAYESLSKRMGGGDGGDTPDDAGEWKDLKRKGGKLRDGHKEHGLWPIAVLLLALAASAYVDVGIFFSAASLISTSPSSQRYQGGGAGRHSGGTGDAGELLFAVLVVGAIIGSVMILRQDFMGWKSKRRAEKLAKRHAATRTTPSS